MREYFVIEEDHGDGDWQQYYHDFEEVRKFPTLEEAVQEAKRIRLVYRHYDLPLRIMKVNLSFVQYVNDY